jgi:ADP-ribose pyrophosphatase YjhB (NUDIX family)
MTRLTTKSRPIDWRGLPSSPTSFCIFPIRDPAFSPELMVLLVYNHADKGKKNALILLTDQDELPAGLNELAQRSDKKKGKPAGYGMPGGGLNPEWLESMECTAIRESGNESGVKVVRVRLIPIPGEKNKALILNKKAGEFVRCVLYTDSQQASITIRPWEKVLLNPMNYYIADVEWVKSRAREFLIYLKNELVAKSVCTEEAIARLGISVNDLTRDELLALKVHPEEVDEIGGFALLPIRLLRQMIEDKRFYLNPEEDRENRLDPTSYIYRSHVERIIQGLDIMGVV